MKKIFFLSLLVHLAACMQLQAATIQFSYDQAGRLAEVNVNGGKKIVYSFDAGGNLLTRGILNLLGGDVDNNNQLDLADVILGLQVITAQNTSTAINRGADVDEDHTIGLAEVIAVLQEVKSSGDDN